MEQRTNIKFCFKLGKTAAETVEMMRQVYTLKGCPCAQTPYDKDIETWRYKLYAIIHSTLNVTRGGRSGFFALLHPALAWDTRDNLFLPAPESQTTLPNHCHFTRVIILFALTSC
jgi:hypothetical protein